MFKCFPSSLKTSFVGAGVLQKLGAECFMFFSGFHLPERWNFYTDSWYDPCADCVALIYAQIFVQCFVRRLRRFYADFSSTF